MAKKVKRKVGKETEKQTMEEKENEESLPDDEVPIKVKFVFDSSLYRLHLRSLS